MTVIKRLRNKYTDFLFDKINRQPFTSMRNFKSKWEVIQVDLINCKPEEFDAKYEAACRNTLTQVIKLFLMKKIELMPI